VKNMQCKCNTCPYFHDFCARLRQLPFYSEFRIPKNVLQELPECFEETLLGEPKGELRQFRGPYGSHILEYENEWILHRDKVDPRSDPLGHLVNDAPHVLLLGSLLVLVFFGLIFVIGGERK